MISSTQFLYRLIYIKSLQRININLHCCRNGRCVSTTIKDLQPKDFRKKTEKFAFHAMQNTDANADIFGTLTNNIEVNHKLDSLPPEADDIIQYDKNEQQKRLHITEYHKLIQELIKQHKVYIFKKLENIINKLLILIVFRLQKL